METRANGLMFSSSASASRSLEDRCFPTKGLKMSLADSLAPSPFESNVNPANGLSFPKDNLGEDGADDLEDEEDEDGGGGAVYYHFLL